MKESSRRGFLVATGTGVAAAAIAPALMSPATAEAAAGGAPRLVAYVKDAKSGAVVISAGEREVTVTDKDLAARIQSYARS